MVVVVAQDVKILVEALVAVTLQMEQMATTLVVTLAAQEAFR